MKYFKLLFITFTMIACTSVSKPDVTQIEWGTVNSEPVYLYTLTNSNGITAKITNYGGFVVELLTPDRNGEKENIVIGLPSLEQYLGNSYLGCIVGRYANRIANARFTLDGVEYQMVPNNGKNLLHGGAKGFNTKVWTPKTSVNDKAAILELSYVSPDMEEGFPGNLTTIVRYELTNDNELQIHYKATTDKPTVLNLTNHSYFNLTGRKDGLGNHRIKVYADAYLPVDEGLIPIGEVRPVDGTPFDLREWKIFADQFKLLPKGYDHNFCVKGITGKAPVLVAELYEPQSGRLLQTYTTEPGMQIYTGTNPFENVKFPEGVPPFTTVCFETQHYPDSPNQSAFPSTVLRPGEVYEQTTIYKFAIKQE